MLAKTAGGVKRAKTPRLCIRSWALLSGTRVSRMTAMSIRIAPVLADEIQRAIFFPERLYVSAGA